MKNTKVINIFTKSFIVFFGIFLLFGSVFVSQAQAQACYPNTCLGTNAYMKVNHCDWGGSSGCINRSSTIEYNSPITCGADCTKFAPGLNGCNGNEPKTNPDGTIYCGTSKGGTISCCSNEQSPTSPPTCGNGSCGSGESCENCPSDCGACNSVDWSYVTVTVYDENGNLQAPSNRTKEPASNVANRCKGYGFSSATSGKDWSANNNCQNTWLVDPNKSDKSYTLSGIDSIYTGCRATLNGSALTINKSGTSCTIPSRNYQKNGASIVITLTKAAPTPTTPPDRAPECHFFNGSNSITKGPAYTYEVGARDLDDGTANGAGIGIVQLFWRSPGGSDWTQLQVNDYAAPYSFSLATNNIAITGASRTIELVANVYKTANCLPKNKFCTSGNSNGDTSTWTISSACRKTVTVTPPSNTTPTGNFITAPSSETTNLQDGEWRNFQARCSDVDSDLGKARIMRSEKALSGGTWPGGWITGSSERQGTGLGSLDTGVVTLSCTGAQAQKSHRMMVECEDTRGGRCSSDPTRGWTDCGSNDFKIVNCLPPVSPTPSSCGGSIPANAQAHDSEESTSPIPSGTSWSYAATDGTTKCQYRCSAGFVRSGSACVAPSPTPGSCGGSIPANAQAHDTEEDDPPVPAGTSWSYSANDGTTKCQYKCSTGFVRSGNACVPTATSTPVPGSCGGSIPSGAIRYDAEEESQPIPAGTNWTYRASDNGTKCQYTCNTGYTWDGNSCEPDVQTRSCGQSCDGTTTVCDSNAGLTCRNSICRNSSCNNASQNAQCVCAGAPTNTPAPVACATPSGLNCGGSCNTSGDMVLSCTFTRDPRVSGFTVNYDDDSAFGTDSQNINTSVSGNTASVTWDATTTFPNLTHWYRIRNRTSDGSCVVGNNQYTNTVSTGPASCATYSCTTVRPANSTIHPDDEPPTGGNLRWAHSTTDNNRQCEFFCNSGYTYNSTSNSCETTSYSCGGTRPANTLFYNGDSAPTGSGVNWTYAAANTGAKCEFYCDTGYQWNSSTSTCVLPLNACVAPVITGGAITCANDGTLTGSWNSVAGASTYRYQRNTSASTTGAVQANVSGTSISVPIEDPSVTNYYRVRVQTVTNSATCTDPGAWSAWRSVSANTNCAAPTATPIVTSCVRPDLVTVTASCNPSPRIGASWDKVAGVLGYEYQIKLDSETWNNRADTTYREVAQPVGNATPPSFSGYVTLPNPPEYDVRVRSICSDGAGGEVTSPTWRSGTSDFASTTCAGPTSTPVPPPPYDVTIKFYQTNNSNQCVGAKALESQLINRTVRIRNNLAGINELSDPPFSGDEVTLTGLSGYGVNTLVPQISLTNSDYEPATCQNQINLSLPPAATIPFYLTKISGPWWQSSFGDVYGDTIISKIPISSSHLSVSGSGSDAGAIVWSNPPTLGAVSQGNASEKGYRDQETINASQKYAYFNSMLNSSNVASVMQTNSGTYKVSGTSSVDAQWNISSNKKVTVIVPGDLNINANITVDDGSFLFLVVDGNITIASNVTNVEGIYLTDGNIDIATARPSADDQKIRFEGSVISFGNGGITSNRSLPSPRNNTEAATEFVYRPDIVINTPDNLKSKSTVWQEVAP